MSTPATELSRLLSSAQSRLLQQYYSDSYLVTISTRTAACLGTCPSYVEQQMISRTRRRQVSMGWYDVIILPATYYRNVSGLGLQKGHGEEQFVGYTEAARHC